MVCNDKTFTLVFPLFIILAIVVIFFNLNMNHCAACVLPMASSENMYICFVIFKWYIYKYVHTSFSNRPAVGLVLGVSVVLYSPLSEEINRIYVKIGLQIESWGQI